jgi:hypothetical protein
MITNKRAEKTSAHSFVRLLDGSTNPKIINSDIVVVVTLNVGSKTVSIYKTIPFIKKLKNNAPGPLLGNDNKFKMGNKKTLSKERASKTRSIVMLYK